MRSVLLAAVSVAGVVGGSGAGAAGTVADSPATVSEIVVTGLPEPKGDKAYDIVAVTAEQLRTAPSGRLDDVLFNVAGFQEYRRSDTRSANPTSQGATLRSLGGNASSRALVLLDGAPVADPFTGYVPWSALSPDRLGEVRVTRGAGAGAFGTGALAGVIELESASPASLPRSVTEVDGGSFGSLTAETVDSATLGKASASVFGRFDRGNGYYLVDKGQRGPVDIPASYKQGSVGLHALAPLRGNIDLQLNTLAFDDQRVQGVSGTTTEVQGVDSSLRLVGHGAWPWEALGYLQLMNFTNSVAAVSPTRTAQTPSLNEFDTPSDSWGGKVETRPPIGAFGEARLGVDLRDETGRDNELSKYVTGQFTQLLRAGGHERIVGGYGEWDDEVIRDVTVTAGARLDHWAIDGGSLVETNAQSGVLVAGIHPANRDKWESTARGGLAWDVEPNVRLRGAAYFGYRLPSLNELYRPFRVGANATAANPALNPERLKGVEAGLDFQPTRAVKMSVTAFENRLEGAIANVTLGAGPGIFPQVGLVALGGLYSQRQNLNAIFARGVEVETHAAWRAWRFDASYAYTKSRDEASGLDAALNGRTPAQTPEHQTSATLGVTPFAGATLSVTGRYVSGQPEDDIGSHILAGAATMDAAAELPLDKGLQLILRGENLTDARVETGISTTGLVSVATPRTLWAGLRLAF